MDCNVTGVTLVLFVMFLSLSIVGGVAVHIVLLGDQCYWGV